MFSLATARLIVQRVLIRTWCKDKLPQTDLCSDNRKLLLVSVISLSRIWTNSAVGVPVMADFGNHVLESHLPDSTPAH